MLSATQLIGIKVTNECCIKKKNRKRNKKKTGSTDSGFSIAGCFVELNVRRWRRSFSNTQLGWMFNNKEKRVRLNILFNSVHRLSGARTSAFIYELRHSDVCVPLRVPALCQFVKRVFLPFFFFFHLHALYFPFPSPLFLSHTCRLRCVIIRIHLYSRLRTTTEPHRSP